MFLPRLCLDSAISAMFTKIQERLIGNSNTERHGNPPDNEDRHYSGLHEPIEAFRANRDGQRHFSWLSTCKDDKDTCDNAPESHSLLYQSEKRVRIVESDLCVLSLAVKVATKGTE